MKRVIRVARFVRIALEAVGNSRMARDQSVATRANRLHFACAEIAATHGLRVDITGQLPRGPAVLVANHLSYLDIIAIAATRPCVPIAKGEVASWPVVGAAAAGLGAIFVERRSQGARARALRLALAALRAGTSVLNFPEGTTTDGSQLLPFHRGIFGIARIAGVPIVPIAIRCAREVAWHGNAPFIPHYLRTAKTDPQMHLEIGKPIEPVATADELALVAHHRIAHALRDRLEPHAAVLRFRVPSPRPEPFFRLAR